MNQTESKSQPFRIVYHTVKPDGLQYAREKLGVAVWKLATGIESIKARLADAYVEIAILQESDFPPELRDQWRQIRSELTSGKMQYNTVVKDRQLVKVSAGRLYSTLRFMRKSKAKHIAEQIFVLEAKLNNHVETNSNT